MTEMLINPTATTAAHPLDRLPEEESLAAVGLVRADKRFRVKMRFGSVNLHLPPKEEVIDFVPGVPFERAADIVLVNIGDGSTHEVTASLTAGGVTRWERLEGVQASVMLDEFFEAEKVIRADKGFKAALAKRGIIDMSLVTVDPWSAGNYGDPQENGARVLRALVWVHHQPGDNQYARPVDGLMVIVDLARKTVIRIDDERVLPVPPESSEWSRMVTSDHRSGVKPLQILQPEGPSFTVDGDHLSWQKRGLRVGWTSREGLVINTVTYTEGDDVRPVLYRASLAEMTVPYGDPSSTQARKNAFDVGEYGLGMLANSLRLGCDCLGEIRYLDAHVCNAAGEVVPIPQAICIHEEDFGISWKHTDFRTEDVEVRRLRRLVVSFIATVGNYEYGIYWYFYTDGRIENEIKLTGILSTAGLDDGETSKYGTTLAPNLYGPNHQHFFCTRLDMMVDGTDNSVVEVNVAPAPAKENPWGNAFVARQTVLWVTPYQPDEMWPAGTYPNQHAGGDGLPAWTAADRPIENTDVVLWYVMGHTHIPSLEDWPVMPVAHIGFTLKPSGFFDRSPAMDLPPSDHCH